MNGLRPSQSVLASAISCALLKSSLAKECGGDGDQCIMRDKYAASEDEGATERLRLPVVRG